jgi:hypothetical protein
MLVLLVVPGAFQLSAVPVWLTERCVGGRPAKSTLNLMTTPGLRHLRGGDALLAHVKCWYELSFGSHTEQVRHETSESWWLRS